MAPDGPIRIVAIGGSVRPGNYTMKALALAVDALSTTDGVEVELVDPATIDWPAPGLGGGGAELERVQKIVEDSEGILFATPEYHGSVSSVLKRVIENLGFPSRLAGKQVALLGVAAGAIGAIKSLEQLRSICAHVGSIVLPGVVSVPGVQEVFDEDGRCLDAATEERIRGLAQALVDSIRDTVCPRLAMEEMARETNGD